MAAKTYKCIQCSCSLSYSGALVCLVPLAVLFLELTWVQESLNHPSSTSNSTTNKALVKLPPNVDLASTSSKTRRHSNAFTKTVNSYFDKSKNNGLRNGLEISEQQNVEIEEKPWLRGGSLVLTWWPYMLRVMTKWKSLIRCLHLCPTCKTRGHLCNKKEMF